MQRVCIVGSGPSGFYAAKQLFRKYKPIQIDMVERLPIPYGLVRYGVAPDHPEVKNVINDFDKVASHQDFRFFGNVTLGEDVSVHALRKTYDATILAYGASGDKLLEIPGEDLEGVYSANDFVLWYNGHPDKSYLVEQMYYDSKETKVAAIIGNGNVALDVARILTKDTTLLMSTDISQNALNYINNKNISMVHILGRRGWAQASFTNKELRELLTEDSILPIIDPREYEECLNEESMKEIESSRSLTRSRAILEKMVDSWSQRNSTNKKVIQFRYLYSPLEILASYTDSCKVGSIRLGKNRLIGPAHSQRSAPADAATETLDISLLIKSVGLQSLLVDGLPVLDGKVAHTNGRVFEPNFSKPLFGGLYVSGWLKRGPKGIIATNIMDSQETVNQVIEDLYKLRQSKVFVTEASNPPELLFSCKENRDEIVTFNDWLKVKHEEIGRGQQKGKTACKFESVQEIFKFLKLSKCNQSPLNE